jgi:aerobic C4-dicarboxylate transport protein
MLCHMKIWLKYLIGALLGLVLALVFPPEDTRIRETLAFLFDLSMRIGRYALLPLMLFSVPIAVFELNEDKEFWKNLGHFILVLVAGVAALSFVGVLAAIIANPARIPLVTDASPSAVIPGFRELLMSVFPESPFSALISGAFILPAYFLAILVGLAFSHDRAITKPVVILFDGLSRIFYQINSFFVEFLGILIIVMAANGIFLLRTVPAGDVYRPLLITVGIEILIAALVLIPAALWFFGGRKNPYRVLYALLAPSLAAFVSGDVAFPLGTLMKHAKESLGIQRRSNALVLPLAAVFGRAGSALVSSTTFIGVLSSYSNIGVSPGSLLWILLATPAISILLCSAPDRGTMTSLVILCSLYGKGFENGFLIVLPVALPLIAAGAFLDTLWAGCAALILARRSGHAQEKEARFFI